MVRWLAIVAGALVLAVPAFGAGGASFFVSNCSFSHMSNDDPIVWPRRPGYSHDHTFIGNVSTNAFSTLATLRRARTSCAPADDTAAYWAPTLYLDGRPQAPVGVTVYYRRDTIAKARAFPAGFKMVAGNSHAVRPQSTAVTYWDCGVLKTNQYGFELPAASSSIPTCPTKSQLELHVNFPECWDGRHLDSANHKSHVAYAVAGRCPAGHPVALPALTVVLRYPADLVDAAHTAILSSGGQYSGHADFINAWNQQALTGLVDSCLDAGIYCTPGTHLG